MSTSSLPSRPLRDLSAEARAAVAASRERRGHARIAEIERTLFVRDDRAPRSTTTSSASLLLAGIIAALLIWIVALTICLLA